ncbi:MAG: ATP-binding protein [Vampirovibrionia bacterium]
MAESISNSDNTNIEISDKPKNSITGKFGAYISVLIFMIVIFMTFYAVWTGINVIDTARMDKYKTIELYSHEIVVTYADELVKDDYTNYALTIQNLMKKGIVISSYIVNKDGIIKYSTNKSEIGQNALEIKKENVVQKKSFLKQLYDNITFSKLQDVDFTNFVKLPNTDVVAINLYLGNLSAVATIYRGYIILAIVFLICGFASASILAKMVTKPIQELYTGAKRFSKGEWSYRIQVETDDEIGQLAKSFNHMADELSQIYESLEQKVKERTKELAKKNEEVEIKNAEIEKSYKELKASQFKMLHSEKISTLCQMVSGVAHELNNPINFIYGNIEHLKTYTHDMKDLIDKYTSYEDNLSEEQKEEISEIKEDIDYEYLTEDLDDLLDSCKEGAERTRQIVLDLRNFSRLDEANIKEVNLHEGIDSTLNILHNKYKNCIDVVKNYDMSMPNITCFAGQLNQVFMNLLANAAQAIDSKGTVTITTQKDDTHAKIIISDSGCGISPENLSKIFDPFFTTKDVGEGTGLGLSVSYGIIEKHNGTITVESKIGEGTTFTVKIPLKWEKTEE